jgi:hypothetical protein
VPITFGVALGDGEADGLALVDAEPVADGVSAVGEDVGVDPALGLSSFPPHPASTSMPTNRGATSRNMVRA